MELFSFKKEARVYIVYQNTQYKLDISDINFSQTITEETYSTDTLHLRELFQASRIYKANPANFAVTIPAIRETDLKVVFNRLLDCSSFDLYIETNQDLFKLTQCVITTGSFIIEEKRPLSLTVEGQASRLIRAGNSGTVIPGVIELRSGTRTYNRLSYVSIFIDTALEIEHLTSVSIEIQNNIRWLKNTIIEGCNINDIITYPEVFLIDKKVIAGSFATYAIEEVDVFRDSSLLIKVGELEGSTFYGFDFNLPRNVITTRVATGQIFTHVYDWKALEAPDSLHEIIQYVTYPEGAEGAILDSWNSPILDSWNSPLLESI